MTAPDVTRTRRGRPCGLRELSSLPDLHSLAARVLLPPCCDSHTSELLVGMSWVGEKAPPRSSRRGVGNDWSRAAVCSGPTAFSGHSAETCSHFHTGWASVSPRLTSSSQILSISQSSRGRVLGGHRRTLKGDCGALAEGVHPGCRCDPQPVGCMWEAPINVFLTWLFLSCPQLTPTLPKKSME